MSRSSTAERRELRLKGRRSATFMLADRSRWAGWRKGSKWLAFVNRFVLESGVKNKPPTTQLEVKTLLNRIQHVVGFVYQSIRLRGSGGSLRVEVKIQAHRGIRGKCSTCQQPCPGYDQLPERRWLFVPLWGLVVHFFYPPRRVECPAHGVGVEHIPWSQGKRPVTTAMMGFLARWARRMSWRETARSFEPEQANGWGGAGF